ncbi:MAG: dephospho-CoA kinase [Tissierellia bacterium]|nr:dephospho-CoA kinase [Tissierellia bacterium]
MMQNKKIIIITGSIGTGKSAVTNILRQMGFEVLDSDAIVHEGYSEGKEMYNNVYKFFGKDIIDSDGTLNRQKLGQIVFNDSEKLEKLNEIIHSSVYKKLIEGIDKSENNVIFLDIPLALESNSISTLNYDEIWLVYVNSEIQKERLIKRANKDNKNPQDVLKIISNQLPIEKKRDMVDEIINNEGTLEELKLEVNKLLERKNLI